MVRISQDVDEASCTQTQRRTKLSYFFSFGVRAGSLDVRGFFHLSRRASLSTAMTVFGFRVSIRSQYRHAEPDGWGDGGCVFLSSRGLLGGRQ